MGRVIGEQHAETGHPVRVEHPSTTAPIADGDHGTQAAAVDAVSFHRATLLLAMNIAEFAAVFDRFQVTAFRLETLPRYADDEDEEFAIFLAGEPLSERSARTVPWLRRVAETTVAGARWWRVHVLSRPLTDYLRF